MRRVRFSGSSMALNLAQLMTPKPRKTPHSTTEPLTGIASLKSSYNARNRFRCWRLTYFGKFSSRASTVSALVLKIASILRPTCCSDSVRNVFIWYVRRTSRRSYIVALDHNRRVGHDRREVKEVIGEQDWQPVGRRRVFQLDIDILKDIAGDDASRVCAEPGPLVPSQAEDISGHDIHVAVQLGHGT